VRQRAKRFLLRAAVRGTTRKCRGTAEESLSSALPRCNRRKPLTCLRKESEGNCSRKGFFRGYETSARGARTWSVVPRPFHGRIGEFCPQNYRSSEDINSFRGRIAATVPRHPRYRQGHPRQKQSHPPPIRRSPRARLMQHPRIPDEGGASLHERLRFLAPPPDCCVAPATGRHITRRCTSDVTDSPAMM
jgi:hypothetical protein